MTPIPLRMVRVGMVGNQTVRLGRNGDRGVRLVAANLLVGGVEAEDLPAAALEGVVTTIPRLLAGRLVMVPLVGSPLRIWPTC